MFTFTDSYLDLDKRTFIDGVYTQVAHHPEALAREADIQSLSKIMSEVDMLENDLLSHGKEVNAKTIEIKSRIKKTIQNPNVRSLLNRLEIKGEPVWGLSSKERDLVRSAKNKYMS